VKRGGLKGSSAWGRQGKMNKFKRKKPETTNQEPGTVLLCHT